MTARRLPFPRRVLAVLAVPGALAALASAASCVATEAPPPARGIVVSGPPPSPVAEAAKPAAPDARALWIAGYWHWTGSQYAWIPGHWEDPPAGARWQAPRYSSADGSYTYEAGSWTGRDRTASPPDGRALR